MKKLIAIISSLFISIVLSSPAQASAGTHMRVSLKGDFSTVVKDSAMSRKQAIAKAKEYLAFTAFSRKGLISQLKFEGFSSADATYAVDHISVNWNTQAYKKAKEYLNFSSFSKKSLYSQLIFEGFTAAQAQYGVNKAYK